MVNSNFHIHNKVQTVEVIPSEIKGSFDGLSSFLEIFLHFTYRFPADNLIDIISANAKLKLSGKNSLLAQLTIPIGLTVPHNEYKRGEWFKFKLENKFIKAIEDNRKGDPSFYIELEMLASSYKEARSGDGAMVKVNDSCHKDKTDLYFTIPKSIWVEKLMSDLNYQSFKLVEIPLTHKTLKEAYVDIIFEFNKAEEYFNNQDYDKCVAHCRSAMDALSRNLVKIKAHTPSESSFKWLEKINSNTFKWIDEVNKANKAISNKSHHSGHKNAFEKYEAESVYLTTLGLMHFIAFLK
ncbi:MAG TPA: hypothetical protein PLN13_10315 [Bacteroidia bacterium]|nr:hypothetical protein [Bacteroidia bacterium]HRH08965.1 hypothetical protein [Bacteroidia bacterium]